MIALGIFMIGAALQLCFALPSMFWWSCVILVVFAGLARVAVVSGAVLPSTTFMFWCLVNIIYRCAAYSWSIDSAATTGDILHFLCLLSFFFAALQLLSKESALKYFGFVAAVVGGAIFLFLAYHLALYILKHGYVSGKDFKYLMYSRHGLHVHMIIFAFGTMVILALLCITNRLIGKKTLIYSYLALLVPMFFVFALGARNVLLQQVAFCGSLAVIRCFKRPRWVISLGMILTVFMLVAFVALGDGMLPKNIRDESTHRDQLWSKSYQAAMESPLTGFGYGTAGKVLGQTTNADQMGVSSGFGGGAHNIFFNALIEGGWFGFGLVLSFFFIVVLDSGGIAASASRSILLALVIGLWARGFVEVGGLFGTGNGVGDYLSWLCIAAYYGCRTIRTEAVTEELYGVQNAP